MAYIVHPSFETRFRPDIECLDDTSALAAFGRNHTNNGMTAGVEIPPELIPRHFRSTPRQGMPNGFFSCVVAIAVDVRGKTAIEKHEPGVHRFHAVEITMQDGTPLERPHFLLNCCTKIEAIDPAHSKVKVRHVLDAEKYPDAWLYVAPGLLEPLAVFQDRIAGRAMWYDRRLNHLFLSDDVVKELLDAGVEGLRLSPRVSEV